ncbi:hypothetical protein D9619_011193 [Psilocybe cf. subviscida]|uniref:NACHT domain-containing protein n=1 Tax=Psilocybe cf. subviscida TaxID=2480587 RepID=A0A8H5F5A4_9AGAR|nr:hypothetical protein D9619_011193 [Psilocybe cf. subviscida]
MKSKKRSKAKRPNPSPSAAGIPSMFNQAQNVDITGGLFSMTTNVTTVNGPLWDVFYDRVVPNAILNAGGRPDEVRCHPGTREEVISRIEKWGSTQDGRTAPMFWLSGPAGAGKSAIVQTIAERCDQHKVPQVNFFFFRADPSRSNASPLVATLLHQIILLYPSLRDPVANMLTINPLIFGSVLENQLVQLIVTPLQAIKQSSSSSYRPLMLLIDGLDECDSESKRSQQQILRAFDKVLAEHPSLFCLLVASRDEPQITMAFNQIASQLLPLYLDSKYSPDRDIRVFVNDEFKKVRKTHALAHTLDASWPSVEDLNFIVDKSSGQFIYAATVMRFISDSAASPMISLKRVQGAARLATKSPFSHLDAIYSYILSQADDQEALKDILHAQLLITRSENSSTVPPVQTGVPLIELLELYNQRYTNPMVLSCLADLTPIAWYASQSGGLLFHHASFSDYLLDQSRSRDYFVDEAVFTYKLLPVVWTHVENRIKSPAWQKLGLDAIRQLEKAPPGFMKELASSDFWCSPHIPQSQISVLQAIHNLCICDDDINNFRRVMSQWFHNPGFGDRNFDSIKHLPYSRRYFQMARAEFWKETPDVEMVAALRPKTDLDRRESALWINDLLHRIHREIYRSDAKRYQQLLKAWIEWAVGNDIPLDGLDDLPDAQQYLSRSGQSPDAQQHVPKSKKKKSVVRNFIFGARKNT